MSEEPARDALFEALWVDEPPSSVEQGWALIDAYAHELAEKQRAWAREPSVVVRVEVPELLDSIVHAAVACAADLIDPEVLNSE